MLGFLLVVLALGFPSAAQTLVTTAQYDNGRTGANIHETVLKPANVSSPQFGRLFVARADGDVYTQPLYVPDLDVPGKGKHKVIFFATEHDSVYAFDATGQPPEPLWRTSFLRRGVSTVPENSVRCPFISPEVGITPTPVIDAPTKTMYVLARTSERDQDGSVRFYQQLHALDITTGLERPGSPVPIRASVSRPALFGLTHTEVTFHALLENPRAALLLANGTIYIAWGSSCDVGPYYGWVLAYDARTLRQVGVFNASPDSGESGIWQADAGLAADAGGNVYAVTGNGKFDVASGGADYGDSVLKLKLEGGGLKIRDYFTPYNERDLNSNDDDLGSSGPVLLPDSAGGGRRLLVVAGKAGVIYLIDRDRMGGFRSGSDSHAVQTLRGAGTGAFGAPAYWNGHLYYFGSEDTLKDFRLDGGRLSAAPVHQGTYRFKDPGAIPAVSADGAKDGIVWVVLTRGWRIQDRGPAAVLQAYDAGDVGRQLYSSEERSGDGMGTALRFAMPTVADGRVYVGTQGAVYAYGLRSSPAPQKELVRQRRR